jgi:Rod binding domain-containing protein
MDVTNTQPAAALSVAIKPPSLAEIRAEFANPKTAETKKLAKAAKDFEAVFINQMLASMDATIDREDSLLSGGSAEDTFRGMMHQEMATSMAHHPSSSGIGMAHNVFAQTFTYLQQAKAQPASAVAHPSLTVPVRGEKPTDATAASAQAMPTMPTLSPTNGGLLP